ncbi:MAG TPA: hypothetical protein VNE00_04130 [Paraburkholderia sp.]|jgi:hypothetical protein|nr:hypothetical protein [Paraburkholderia sp.]
MKKFNTRHWCLWVGVAGLLAGCSGGGGGTASSTPASLSADQRASEQFLLAPNASFSLHWQLPFAGAPVNGTDFISQAHATMAASPLTAGPQKLMESAPVSIASTLALRAGSPARFVVGGKILVESGALGNISYQGSGVRVDELAVDGVTVVDSQLRSNYSVVGLSGTVASAPVEFAQFFNSLYFNPTLLKASATWSAGAAYVKYTATQIGDAYTVMDFAGTTTGNAPAPVATGTTIAALMAAGGIAADGTTYTLGNGSESNIGGVNTYVATNPVPNLTTTVFRTFYELNGNVYIGELIRSGTVAGGNPFAVAAPGSPGFTLNFTQQFQIRLNAAALASLQAALTF